MKFKVIFSLGLLFLLTLAILFCIPISLAKSWYNSQPVDDAIKSKLLYEDNFSTTKISIFGSYSDEDESQYLENGKYRFVVNNTNYWARQTGGNNSSDIILEVQATQVSGPNDNVYGVIFRRADTQNYYTFFISGDGYYEVAKRYNGTWTPKSWKKSSAIHTGNATNLIRISCEGDQFNFYVNDIKVDEFRDNHIILEGKFGLIAGTTNGPRGVVTIDFDNLKVWEISKQ